MATKLQCGLIASIKNEQAHGGVSSKERRRRREEGGGRQERGLDLGLQNVELDLSLYRRAVYLHACAVQLLRQSQGAVGPALPRRKQLSRSFVALCGFSPHVCRYPRSLASKSWFFLTIGLARIRTHELARGKEKKKTSRDHKAP